MKDRMLIAPFIILSLLSVAPGPTRAAPDIHVKGSDTIGGALGPALARAYEARNPGVEIAWESLGSGTAFVGLADGSAQLGASSRSIKSSELEEMKRLGIPIKEFVLGYDGIAILVHPSNAVPSLGIGQLARIFSGTVTHWREVGGPDRPIKLISRPSYSGTHGFFAKAVLGKAAAGPASFAPQTEFVEHSADIVARVAAAPQAISYLGMGWQADSVRTVPVTPHAASDSIRPSLATVRDGSYPIFRPLLLYTRGEPQGELRRFLAFLLSATSREIVAEQGFIPSDTATQIASRLPVFDHATEPPIDVVRIFFRSGINRLNRRARAELDRLTDLLAARPGSILLTGHADATGDEGVNRRVALGRARAVAQYLSARGVDPARIGIETRGEEQPIATNDTATGRRQNRRVDVRVLPPTR